MFCVQNHLIRILAVKLVLSQILGRIPFIVLSGLHKHYCAKGNDLISVLDLVPEFVICITIWSACLPSDPCVDNIL